MKWVVGSQVFGDGFNLYDDDVNEVVAWVAPRLEESEDGGPPSAVPADMHLHPVARLIISAPDLVEACRAEHAPQGGVQLLRDAASDCRELGRYGTASALEIMADRIDAAMARATGVLTPTGDERSA